MEESKSGIINVRIPLDKVEELERLSARFGLNKSRMIKFALRRFLDMVESTPACEEAQLVREIRRVSDEMKAERPKHYRPRGSNRDIMLVAEEPDNSWKAPKKRGRKKKSDQNPLEEGDESSPKE